MKTDKPTSSSKNTSLNAKDLFIDRQMNPETGRSVFLSWRFLQHYDFFVNLIMNQNAGTDG